ncbi:AMP-activated protein kinase [Scenedesmus sp. NREL 46B-D3]|nr:AMP-activated protein kinase [Scenedesmus sp. NREL 46B-D3]
MAQLLLLVDITCSQARRVGKYTLGRVLGAGASGVVRLGKTTATDELVAVKAVDATRFRSICEIEQVQEEMAVLAQLHHPNIIRLLEVVFTGGCFFFIMEYASGGSLAAHMAGQPSGRLSEAAAKDVFGSILAALEYCHKRRVIHRDLKPENILMEGGTPKIADFGLAGVVAPFNGSGFKLQCGTPEFTAPEIVGGAEYEGTAVDLWSVGVMLYEALSGQLPFHGSSQPALFRSIRRGAYPPLPKSISADARDLVKRLLTVDPAARITGSSSADTPG